MIIQTRKKTWGIMRQKIASIKRDLIVLDFFKKEKMMDTTTPSLS